MIRFYLLFSRRSLRLSGCSTHAYLHGCLQILLEKFGRLLPLLGFKLFVDELCVLVQVGNSETTDTGLFYASGNDDF